MVQNWPQVIMHVLKTLGIAKSCCKGWSTKDQSYFLCRLNQQQLNNALFPIGHLHKHQIREIAKQNGIPVHQKKDSTGICFIGERKFNDFLSQYLLDRPGDIVEKDTGKILGTHHGLIYYTIGQRKGLNIPAKNEQSSPWFVVDKDLPTQTLFVAQGEDNPALFNQNLMATQLHWVGEPLLAKSMIGAKIRYRQPTQEAMITQVEDDRIQISFTAPQRAITPGQYVVLYQSAHGISHYPEDRHMVNTTPTRTCLTLLHCKSPNEG